MRKSLLCLFFGLLFLHTTLFSQTKSVPAIVDINYLKEHLNDTDVVIVDLRKELVFNKEHIKNAVNIPAYENLFAQGYFMPGLNELKQLFSKAGINSDMHVIAYDNGDFIWAARLYWILETLGHTKVSILDVGFNYWKNKQLPTSTQAISPSYKEFVPRVDDTKLQTKLGTLVSIGEKTIIDGRQTSHYLGEESLAKRFGHIPTAQNYACTQNYQVSQTGNEMKDLQTLKKMYEHLPKDKEIILYCDGGAEAALNYVVLQELGYKVSVYDGSWVEWGNDENVPIENPSLKD
jgi:thiosulfate/3-mercaptopyruvate sulfurtransferase